MAANALSPTQQLRRPRRKPRVAAVPVPERRESSFDRDYWVGHCEGYRVEGHAGRIGFVEEVRDDPAEPSRKLLAIRAGLLGRRLIVLSADEIEFIVPRAERIWIRAPHTILGSEAA